jgi:hypothetical protein
MNCIKSAYRADFNRLFVRVFVRSIARRKTTPTEFADADLLSETVQREL